ncbi:hypothetical protein [Aegicerativicinus sediminis]|uniref:hypothetical protein n=1 Tax=Aegicerativicinus sediminis TaxID=2893202 RepID=UPI001E43168B|nr:hypothetical protein [Aegicerativicinus sediminis]
MRKTTFRLGIFLSVLFISCSTEPYDAQLEQALSSNNDAFISANMAMSIAELTEEDACFTTELIAGQHYTAGDITIYVEDGNLIIVYSTNEDWTLGTTHLQVGNCEGSWVPLTKAGNPKVGRFDYKEPYSADEHEVIYVIPLEDIDSDGEFCFAAHAEVQGPTGGETAWGKGDEFEGRSWAMYFKTDLTECIENDDPSDNPDDDSGDGDDGSGGPI